MIWALLAWYFFGGVPGEGASLLTTAAQKDLSLRVEIAVDETGRRERALSVLKSLKKEAKEFERVFAKSGRQLNSLYRDQSSSRDEALAILDTLNADWEGRQAHALDAWFELRGILTEDEWLALFGEEAARRADSSR